MGSDDVRELVVSGSFAELRDRAYAGSTFAAELYDDLGALLGWENELPALEAAGNAYAIRRMAVQRSFDDDLTGLRALADQGHRPSEEILVRRLVAQEAIGELRARAAAGSYHAATELPWLLIRLGRLDEVRADAEAGDWASRSAYVRHLLRAGEPAEVERLARAGDTSVAGTLAYHYEKNGELEKALEALTWAGPGGDSTRERLLGALGRTDELRALATTSRNAHRELLELLARQKDVAGLREFADAGDLKARDLLIDVLGRLRLTDELRPYAEAGHAWAKIYWITAFRERGDERTLRRLADEGGELAEQALVQLFREQGRDEDLRRYAESGSEVAQRELANRARRAARKPPPPKPDLDTYRARALNGGGNGAWINYLDALEEQGRDDELRSLVEAGHAGVAHHLARVLVRKRLFQELADRAEAGDAHAGRALANVLDPPPTEEDRPDY
ncbi:hypothetical protein [Amycolatopsis sp. 195334CR]|uniref:hypothetical protein n=1 Tax=Amycolatopsis sp. 195334CR TaxID=2814588 RepID=UPI001A8F1818|nr:hypothetical protein [Amycolatopsis sp. 195334CR]MBN6037027.1 hypothetical protein [Amycolatopsis sp. 195334CR]